MCWGVANNLTGQGSCLYCVGSFAQQSAKMTFHLELLYWNCQSEYVLCETQSGGLCLDNFDLRCKSLRLVVIKVRFYYVNVLSGAGCPAKWAFQRDNSAPRSFFPSFFCDWCLRIPFEIADTKLSSKKVNSKLLQSDSSAPILSRQWAAFVSPAF